MWLVDTAKEPPTVDKSLQSGQYEWEITLPPTTSVPYAAFKTYTTTKPKYHQADVQVKERTA